MKHSRSAPSLPLLACTLLAAALQFWALDAQSLWYDEGFSVWLARKPVAEIVARTAADIQPPLYYLLLRGWMALVGPSEWALRSLSAGCALLSVPLLAQVARRLLRQRAAAEATALLLAVSPLWLWYGREVRMYALLLALLAAMAWLMVGLLGRPTWRQALLFALLAIAATYSHYYAWFVVAAWALAALVAWGGRWPRRPHLAPYALAFGLPLVAYLPWLGVVLTRLGADRSYWPGTLPLGEVVGEALASWVVGHSLPEAQALPLGWLGGGLALLALAVLGLRVLRRPAAWPLTMSAPQAALPFAHWLMLLLWLLLPLVGLLALSWNRPKYHPRYLLFAAPAFFLLLGGLLGWLRGRRWAGRLAALALMVALLLTMLAADWKLYRDPAFARDDWRSVARYLADHRQPGEPLLLVSGHTFPVLEYYLPDAAPLVRLPDQPTLDTRALLGPEAAQQVAEGVGSATRVWLLQSQDEVVDPEGVVTALFRAAGGVLLPTPSFKALRLSHWQLPAGVALGSALTPQQPMVLRFGDALLLRGWRASPAAPPADGGLPLTLFWEAQRPLTEDWKAQLRVVDGEGRLFGELNQRPTAYNIPTFRWVPGSRRLAAVQVPLQPGTPPGDYWVELALYDEATGTALDVLDGAGNPQGQSVRLGPFPVAPPDTQWLGAGPPPGTLELGQTLLGGHQLLAARLAVPAQLELGQRLPLVLWWRTAGPLPGATLHLAWQQGDTLHEVAAQPPGGAGWPGERWLPGQLLMTPLTVRVPREASPGSARLVAWLSDGQQHSQSVPLAMGTLVAGMHLFEPPLVAQPQRASFGSAIRLLGFDVSAGQLRPGEPVTVTLAWEATGESRQSLTAFVHLLAPDGSIVAGAGQDKLPLDGARPTDGWLVGEFLTDRFQIALPPDAPPGPYTLEVGWYDAADPTFPRLPASGEGAERDRVLLALPLADGR